MLQALFFGLLGSVGAMGGAALLLAFPDRVVTRLLPYLLAVSAASVIYIAVADLVPSLHRRIGAKALASQTLLILAGIGTIAFFRFGHLKP